MAIGWDDIQRMKRVEALANELGFIFAAGYYSYGNDGNISHICLKPMNNELPHYSRDAELFTGTLEDISIWLRGIEWARGYDEMLNLSNNKKRSEKEQTENNKQLMKTLKTGKLVRGTMSAGFLEDAFDEEIDYDDLPF